MNGAVNVNAGNVGVWAGAPLMRESEAARRLGLSKRTLQKWPVTGGGPDFLKFGRAVRYSVEALERWLVRSRRRSTSDKGM
jgi:excisionase family DNA binding protein